MTHEIRNRKIILFIKHNPNFVSLNNREEPSYFDLSLISVLEVDYHILKI